MIKRIEIGPINVYWTSDLLRNQVKNKVSRIVNNIQPVFGLSNGPKQVLTSVLLSKKYLSNYSDNYQRVNWLISGDLEKIINNLKTSDLKFPTILGPNIEFEKFNNSLKTLKEYIVIVPAKWVVPTIISRLKIPSSKIKIWAAGVDTEYWSPQGSKKSTLLIYRKHDLSNDLLTIVNYAKQHSIRYKIVEYGQYKSKQFKDILEESFAAVWIGSTESQGIAIMQAWSMGVPTLVRRKDKFYDYVTENFFASSSAPYLSEKTGVFSESNSLVAKDLDLFFASVYEFKPREYMLENFTIETQIKSFLNLSQDIFN